MKLLQKVQRHIFLEHHVVWSIVIGAYCHLRVEEQLQHFKTFMFHTVVQ